MENSRQWFLPIPHPLRDPQQPILPSQFGQHQVDQHRDQSVTHTTRVTLYRDSDRVDLANEITANFTLVLRWDYSFNLTDVDTWHEEVGAVIRARLTTAGGHYSPCNARYDFLTLNHFADMSGSDGVGMTLSNADCYFIKLGNSTVSNLDTTTPVPLTEEEKTKAVKYRPVGLERGEETRLLSALEAAQATPHVILLFRPF